jgi:hypothetical protein
LEQIKTDENTNLCSNEEKNLDELLQEKSPKDVESLAVSIGFILGGGKKKDQEEAKKCQLIFSTYPMSSEALGNLLKV